MQSVEKLFHAQLVEIAYKHLKVSAIAILINAAILLYIAYPYIEQRLGVIWFLSIAFISVYRFVSAIKYEKNPQFYSAEVWEKKFFYLLLISSLLWSVAPFIFFVEDNYMLQASMLIIYAGLSAGAMSSLSSIVKQLRIFLTLLILPIIFVFLLQNTSIHYAFAGLVSLFFVMMVTVGNRFHQNYKQILEMNMMYKQEQNKVSVSNERFKILFENAPVGFFFYNEELVICEFNQKFMDVLDVPAEKLLGLTLFDLPDQRVVPALKAPLDNKDGVYNGPYTTKYKQKNLYIHMQTSPLRDSTGKVVGAIGIIDDITERMLAQNKIEKQARYDSLTNIPNRLTLKEKLEQEFSHYQRHKSLFALLFIDLDHFKHINDSLGHAIGDGLLIEIARRIGTIVEETDMVARIGGDEFIVLLPELSYDEYVASHRAEQLAIAIDQALQETIVVDEHELSISTSIGIALVNENDRYSDDILKHADIAMYQAKKDGRSTIRFYQQQMDEWIKRRLALETGLRHGLVNGELEVYYQPIVSFEGDKIIGAEALLRWSSKEFGNVSPVEFIPVAEESGLIIQIGEFVLNEALREFTRWKKESATAQDLKKIAINISVRQFNAVNFVEQLKNAIAQNGIDPKYIELELVESIIIDDVVSTKAKMQELRSLGIDLSIDDFGTGYSSLSYLKQLPFSTLKIDRSFVKDISVDEDDRELIDTIISIAKRFKLQVVAEGVEDEQHHAFLKEKQCEFFQGFYCSPAIESEAFVELLDKKNSFE